MTDFLFWLNNAARVLFLPFRVLCSCSIIFIGCLLHAGGLKGRKAGFVLLACTALTGACYLAVLLLTMLYTDRVFENDLRNLRGHK